MKEVILKCKYPGEFGTLGTLTKGRIYIGKMWEGSKAVNLVDDQGHEVTHKATRFGVVAESTSNVCTKIDPEPVPKSERQSAEEMLVKQTVYMTADGRKFDFKENAIGYQICLNAYKDQWK